MKNRPKKKVIIAGGGLSGIACGLRLCDKAEVLILESENQAGGLAASVQVKNKWIPITYHHVLSVDHVTQRFIQEFGMASDLAWRKVKIAYSFDHNFYVLTKPHHVLTFRVLSIKERIRLALFGAECILRRDWTKLNNLDARTWMEKKLGANATELLFERLAAMKFGIPLSSVSAGWLGSRLGESGKNGENFGYPKTGIKTLIDRMLKRFNLNGKFLFNKTITAIGPDYVRTQQGEEFKYDYIVSTIPPPRLKQIQKIATGLDVEIANIRYVPLICSVFGSKTFLTPYYWNVYMKPALSFGGLFHHTVLYPEGGTEGEYVYYVFTYLQSEKDPLWSKSLEELKSIHLQDVRKLNSSFEEVWWHTFKIRYSTPVFNIGYQCPPIQSKVAPNLFYAGVYRKYPQTRTMHTALGSGEETAAVIRKLL